MSEHLRIAQCPASVLKAWLRIIMSQKHKSRTLPEDHGPRFLPLSQDFQVFPKQDHNIKMKASDKQQVTDMSVLFIYLCLALLP